MNSRLERERMERWCLDAITILGKAGVPEALMQFQRKAVERSAGNSELYAIAESLAIGISELPAKDRDASQEELIRKHGLGISFFLERSLRSVRAILRRGKIRSLKEAHLLSDFVSDTQQSPALVSAAEELLVRFGTGKA